MLYRCCFIESSWEPCKGDLIIIIPILQIRELRVREFLYLSLGSAKQASDLGLEADNLGGEPLWLLRTGATDSEGSALGLLLLSLSCVGLFCGPMHCSPPGSSVHGIFPGKHTGGGCHFFQGPSWLRVQTLISCLTAGFFTTEPPGKEIKPVNPKGNQLWTRTGRMDAEAPILGSPDAKRPRCRERWKARGEEGSRGWGG